MKALTFTIVMVTFISMVLSRYSVASTSFIKYKKYLIPVDVIEELEVLTAPASEVSRTAAKLNLLLKSGEPNITAWFELSQSSQPTCSSAAPAGASALQSGQTYQLARTNLVPGRTYYFRACAINDIGDSSVGEILSFRTEDAETIVESVNASFISQTTATLNGQIVSGTNIQTWFVRGSTNNLQCNNPTSPTVNGGNTGTPRSLNIISLSPNSEYFFKFCALGSDGTKSSATKSFTTLADPSSVTFVSLTGRTDSGATLTSKLGSGQDVTTWYTIRESGLAKCSDSPRFNQQVLQAGQNSVYTATGLTDWAGHTLAFCAQGVNGDMDSFTRSFVTKRKDGKEYIVACSDSTVYNSSNGPLRFYVTTPNPQNPNDDHATYTIYNDGQTNMQYFRQSRVSSANASAAPGVNGPIAIDPAFNNGRFYRLRLFGTNPWRAKVGCITEDIFD